MTSSKKHLDIKEERRGEDDRVRRHRRGRIEKNMYRETNGCSMGEREQEREIEKRGRRRERERKEGSKREREARADS